MNQEQIQQEIDSLEYGINSFIEEASEYEEDDSDFFGIMFEVNYMRSCVNELRAQLLS
ncbi:MAG: hypothetical protein K2X81_13340 [Candidatus Obscuribacterales bacterium]|nr:hypothetical protein [Candidatus Obscuribacterales bacterium]